ncbi:MAG: hypothetical protein ACKO8O_02440, partial [Betaproteobacteria bacterium]
TVFVGYADGGIDRNRTLQDQADRLYGFGAEGIAFSVLSLTDKQNVSYTAVKASASSVRLYGLDPDILRLQFTDIRFEYNSSSKEGKAIDFSVADSGNGLKVAAGTSTITFDMKGNKIGVYVRDALLSISRFVYVRGALAFEKADYGTLRDSRGAPVREAS